MNFGDTLYVQLYQTFEECSYPVVKEQNADFYQERNCIV